MEHKLSGSLAGYVCEYMDKSIVRARESGPAVLWTMEIQKFIWQSCRDARGKGQRLALCAGGVPAEIIAAFGFTVFPLDSLPFLLSAVPPLASEYIDEAEKRVGSAVCSLCKTELGAAFMGELGFEPDLFVYNPLCASADVSHPLVERRLGCPSFRFYTPQRGDERSIGYLSRQIEDFIGFMEELTGDKLDWDKVKPYLENTNRSCELRGRCAKLRRLRPCPLPGRFMALDGVLEPLSCLPEIVGFHESQFEIGQLMSQLGKGPCERERCRVAMSQNMIRSSGMLMDWMEEKFGAVTVADHFGFNLDIPFENPSDRPACLKAMARRMRRGLPAHGVTDSAEERAEQAEVLFREYAPDVSIYLGHVGCKGSWSTARIASGMIQEKFSLPTLHLELDCIDSRYKSREEVRRQISEYFETVVRL